MKLKFNLRSIKTISLIIKLCARFLRQALASSIRELQNVEELHRHMFRFDWKLTVENFLKHFSRWDQLDSKPSKIKRIKTDFLKQILPRHTIFLFQNFDRPVHVLNGGLEEFELCIVGNDFIDNMTEHFVVKFKFKVVFYFFRCNA